MSIFDKPIAPEGLYSLKWDRYQQQDIIPLWLADTDYEAPPAVIEALGKRLDRGIFGYGVPPTSLTEVFVERMQRLFNWSIETSSVIYVPGIVPAINLCCQAFSSEGSYVMLPSPIYTPIRVAPVRSGQIPLIIPMKEKNGRWVMDFDKLIESICPKSKLLLFCNPHNPAGTVYTRDELEQLAGIAQDNDLIVIADEIHSELILDEDKQHIPFASLSQAMSKRTVTLTGTSKTYNLAGLGCGIVVIEDEELRAKFKAAQVGVMSGVNVFGFVAAEAAYRESDLWLTEQINYLRTNRNYLTSHLNKIPGVSVVHTEATYLAWVNISALEITEPQQFFERYGVGISCGESYGDSNYIRINFSCSYALLEEAVKRITKAIKSLNQ